MPEHLNERLRNQVQLPTLVEHYGAIKNVQRIRAGYAPFVYRRSVNVHLIISPIGHW